MTPKNIFVATWGVFAALTGFLQEGRASFLYEEYLTPSFDGQPNSEFSKWEVFYTPSGHGNYPDAFAPNGIKQTATQAGFTAPPNSAPSDPLAFWDVNNPTITQASPAAFIIGAGSAGNIYSFSANTSYAVRDATPYNLGTVVFQFQTEGSLADFNSIKLIYNNGASDVSISASEMIREYKTSGSTFGGLGNRTSLQWNLAGLNVNTYKIVFNSSNPSLSLQEALLDTSATSAAVVPASRTWNTTGAGVWSEGSQWLQGSTSNPNGNVRLTNAGDTAITVDGARQVGEIIFDTAARVTMTGSSITANTGVTTTATASGVYTIQSDFILNSLNVFDVQNGTVALSGVVSETTDGSYGIYKQGAGTLILSGNNSFTGGVNLAAGTLRLEGVNQYTGGTGVQGGKLVVTANVPASGAGALGNSAGPISLGVDASTSGLEPLLPASIWIEGNHTLAKGIRLNTGPNEKILGVAQASSGATFSGAINLGDSGSVKLTAQNSTDIAIFSGAISGGESSKTVTLDGQGTVVYSGANKTYASATNVTSGSLVIQSGTALSGNGNMTVGSGATLKVDGSLGGTGTLILSGGTLTGSGLIGRTFVADAGDVLSPGNSPGILRTVGETWGGGATYLWEIKDVDAGAGTGWDLIDITGALNITANSSHKFTLQITSLDLLNNPGMVGDFNAMTDYSWIIASASSGISGFSNSAFLLNQDDFLNSLSGAFSLSQAGNTILLNYTAIPEPSTYALLGLGLLAMVWEQQRQRKKRRTSRSPLNSSEIIL